ncbi:hypothetical protein OIU85_021460 [Salix viminalis]|uniref:Uncharacterized protein n=1 Tax=Salix viminalis TaxID=40686 RepID=A0A9Q0UID1_SALVM|nr:hypothetical protein OIU85_021460 [Salix viminalis]
MLGITDELADEGLGQFYDNYVDKSMEFFINPINCNPPKRWVGTLCFHAIVSYSTAAKLYDGSNRSWMQTRAFLISDQQYPETHPPNFPVFK